ncbi:MAG TPA: bifunctional (p)ppGpp synthetase/guanosine-3',5'-bis(diphosphate) 3'-pyrophosphohydrolase [Alphaproteobacteria bacterium]|nr:bifunctional (p)ppGpp synthetase/guanosine-3',5'-bis(diphosphate) 3'-pyrophosphohydrolase [Alphaproteobacteria bacterium]HNS43756.1 bifunctional (p)ppGpp synthetase/guanosine-3',5'-bis(diphosphate) 3'-pyrophosphohydrolase [Alphaproteobacteria bacterium]
MTSSAAELVSQIKTYNPEVNAKLIEDAVDFARIKHEGQFRTSGEPYYTHPLEVAGILADMKMDTVTIVTAILHDTLEDTDATYDEIAKKFSPEVASLVNGVSKLSKIESQTIEGKQAENFRKLLLAMSEDIRVLLIKLADRLHNMRTLHHIQKPEKRYRIARETMELYGPLAERVGLHKIKEDIEDLAFSYMNPEARDSITNRLSFLRQAGSDLVNTVIRELNKLIGEAGISGQVTGREKTRYSIWKKMQRKNVSFEQLSDIMAFRIVVDTIAECYHALGVVHSKYSVVPGRFKDYISTPKPNGYRSLHTTVIGPENQRIEIQIRTSEMNAEADLGVAAHWAYKQSDVKEAIGEAKKYRWMRELLDILEQDQRPEDFWENTKLELFQEHVFAFTPKGDLFELPAGSTPIDFAYAIHSDVGNRCVGAKINGRIAPLNTKLQNGDQVEIVTAKTQNPSPTWERFVVTGKARSHIRRFIRQQQRTEYVTLGKAMLQKVFKSEGYEFTDKAVAGIVDQYRECEDVDDVYAGIGAGNIVARDIFRSIFPAHKSDQELAKLNDPEEIPTIKAAQNQLRTGKLQPMPIKGLIPGMAVHFARCCHPLPGDRIVGIVTTGKGVTVHTIDCETLEQFADTPERWIDVSWGEGQDNPENRVGRLMVTISNTPGALGTISTVIGKSGGNITNLKITSRTIDFWDMYLDVAVTDTKHLNNIVAALRATPQIVSVERARGR